MTLTTMRMNGQHHSDVGDRCQYEDDAVILTVITIMVMSMLSIITIMTMMIHVDNDKKYQNRMTMTM